MLFKLGRIGKVYYDENAGFVVRAKDEVEARRVVHETAVGDEGKDIWLDPKATSCEPLSARGPAEVILNDYRAA